MSVTESLMQPGRWELTLSDTTPKSIRDRLDFFGHVLITPIRLDPLMMGSSSAMLAASRYTGILRTKPSRYEIGGPGLLAWLGDEDGKGQVMTTAVTGTAASFSTWVGLLRPASLGAGTVTAIAGTLTKTFRYVDRRTALNFVSDVFAAEYKVTPDGNLHNGPRANLFVTTPTTVVVPKGGGRELNIRGLRAAEVDRIEDADDYTTRTLVLDSSNTAVGNVAGPATPYLDLFGNAVVFQRIVEITNATATEGNSLAQAQQNRFSAPELKLEISTDTYDIGGDVACGDSIYVYDPDIGVVDTANQVQYRGQVIFPKIVRIVSTTWPVERGMGVYYRSGAGVYTDLTDFVEWESGAVRLEIGRRPRKLVESSPHKDRV